uniref:trypsin n=1 Tax=Musca domestica TaxID=7370 RepID=A0A1I8MQV4_MUSDO
MWRLKIILICVRLILQIENASGQISNTTLLGEDLDGFNYITKTKLNKGNNTRIVGGKPINIRQVPWQVALYNDGYFICGGSIISPDWVVTAAHCAEGGGSFAIRAGSPYLNRGGQIRWARLVVVHAGYSARTGSRDIALIRVYTRFRITNFVRPIAIARSRRRLPKKLFGIDDLDYFDPKIYNVNGTRIVGGRPINIRQVPWQVALYDNGYFICGGSIISADWVLTAAHCVEGGGRFAVRAGSSYANRGGQIRRARLVVMHARYNTYTANRDIAMIRVNRRFIFNRFVRPIVLTRTGRRLPQRFFVSGWGSRREGGSATQRLRGVTIDRLNRRRCRAKYARAGVPITHFMFCATTPQRDTCQGDSGGPIVRRRIQYGIVSFGIGCARPRFPGVYTNIRRLNRWIRNVIRRRGGRMPRFS